jgi:hypothetical protein
MYAHFNARNVRLIGACLRGLARRTRHDFCFEGKSAFRKNLGREEIMKDALTLKGLSAPLRSK